MSALAMILTAAMVVLGDGPEDKVSREMAQQRPTLNLKGTWKAVISMYGQTYEGEAEVVDGRLKVVCREDQARTVMTFVKAVDEGGGNLHMGEILGIYKQDGDRLHICLQAIGAKQRPTSFSAEKGQYLIELQRIKPSK